MDMSPEERRLMNEHIRATMQHFAAGKILIFGPVMDPNGVFGMAVFEAKNADELRQILDDDPPVKAGVVRYEIFPMQVGAARGLAQ